MIILAADTTTPSCSVAVMDGEAVRAEMTLLRAETHSKHLHALIAQVLSAAGIGTDALDGFAVSRGPGSFTGLRIGMSALKGLAYGTRRPLIGVSALEALARQAGPVSMQICPMIDARRQQVYAAGFRFENGLLTANRAETVSAPEAVMADMPTPCVFIGSGAQLHRRSITARLGPQAVMPPPPDHVIRAATVAHIAMERMDAFDLDALGRMTPVYIRPSDAEMKQADRRLTRDPSHTI